MTSSSTIAVGCSGLPAGLHRNRYFEKLDFLECPETYGPAPRPKVLRGWREGCPNGRFGLIASQQIGDFRDTPAVRAAIDTLAEQVQLTGAEIVVFRTPGQVSPSAADAIRKFFSEIATAERLGGAARAWEPGELWQPEHAARLAGELELVPVVDPLAENPLGGDEPKPVELFGGDNPIYLRIRPLGRARRGLRPGDFEEIAEIAHNFEKAWVVFATAQKNRDAKTLIKTLEAYD